MKWGRRADGLYWGVRREWAPIGSGLAILLRVFTHDRERKKVERSQRDEGKQFQECIDV